MTQAQLSTAIADAIAKALANKLGSLNKSPKAARKAKKPAQSTFLVDLVVAAHKLGFADAEPNVNLLTYDKWLAKGFRVIPGQKSIVVDGRKSGLFHSSQVAKVA